MHPPPSHVKSKSALLAASSSVGIYLSCFEGKHIASVLDLLPLEEGVALVPSADVHQEAELLEVGAHSWEAHPIDHVVPAEKHASYVVFNFGAARTNSP